MTPGFYVCVILHWYNVLKNIFQQNITMSSLKLSILIIPGLFVGNTFECQCVSFQTCPCANQHNLHLVILGYGQQQVLLSREQDMAIFLKSPSAL